MQVGILSRVLYFPWPHCGGPIRCTRSANSLIKSVGKIKTALSRTPQGVFSIDSIIPPNGENINSKIYRLYAIFDRSCKDNQAFCVVFVARIVLPGTNRAEHTNDFGDVPKADKAPVPSVQDFL